MLGGGDFGELAKELSQDGSGKDGGSLGPLKRGELAAEIESAILRLSGRARRRRRSARRSATTSSSLDSKETLTGEALAQARNQIRDILLREKYQVAAQGVARGDPAAGDHRHAAVTDRSAPRGGGEEFRLTVFRDRVGQ